MEMENQQTYVETKKCEELDKMRGGLTHTESQAHCFDRNEKMCHECNEQGNYLIFSAQAHSTKYSGCDYE